MAPTRRLLSTGSVVLLVLTLSLVMAAPTAAKRKWCPRDPIFLVNGTQVNVEIALREHQQELVSGPLQVILYVPVGVAATVIYEDEGFNGHGEDVLIVEDSKLKANPVTIPILVQAAVPAEATAPVALFITAAEGRSAKAISKTNRVFGARAAVPTTPEQDEEQEQEHEDRAA